MPSGNLTDSTSTLGPKIGATLHPIYVLMKPTWVKLADVREGTGGFLSTGNDSYLMAHPREWLDHSATTTDPVTGATVTRQNENPKNPSPKLKARRRLARYENVAGSLLESKKSLLFREKPTRRVGTSADTPNTPAEIETWWQNVDGDGTAIDQAMPQWWDLAATLGHVVLYADMAPDAEAQTAADQAQPVIRVYTPLDVLDWRRNDNGKLVWIKLLEAIQPPATGQDAKPTTTYRIRVVDETSWTLYDQKGGGLVSTGTHGFETLPVAYLFGKRRSLLSDIGESVLGDPRNHIDLFNLTSELRELLRNQTFSFINLPLGTGPDATSVEAAQQMMGQQTGSMNVLFSSGPASILSADAANVIGYQAEIARVKRDIYREAGVQYESDTKAPEAQGTLELKREEMATRLSMYADECEQTERALVELWYRARYGGEAGVVKMDADEVQIHYPDHFQQTPFKDLMDMASAAQSLGMPGKFMRELRKSVVAQYPGMSTLAPDVLAEINQEIDAMPDDPTPADKMQQKMDLATMAIQNGGPKAFGGSPSANDKQTA